MKGADKTYADVIQEVIAIKGIDVLLDAKLLANCIRDIAGTSWATEYRIAERNLDQDMLRAFHDAARRGEAEVRAVTQNVTERLRYDCGLSQAIAESISCGMGTAVSSYARDEERYAEGERLLALGNYTEALKVFSTLGVHKDAADKASECAELVKLDQAYEKAKMEFSDAVEEGQFQELAKTFDGFDGYKASAKWRRKCLSSADKAREAERIYQEAKAMLLDDTLTAEQYQVAAKLFDLIEWYKDSAQGFEVCEKLALKAASYEKAAMAVETPSSAEHLKEAMHVLESLGSYRRAASYLNEARAKLERQRNYELAIQAENKATKPGQYEDAGQMFKAIGDYKDAVQRAEKNTAYAKKLREEERKRLEELYHKVVGQLEQAQTLEEHEHALKQLKKITGFRDIDDLIEKCRFRIDMLECERAFERAKQAFDESSTSSELYEVARLFLVLGDFGEAEDYAKEAQRRAREAANEEAYCSAISTMNCVSSVAGYERAAQSFDGLGGYKDSQQKARQCRAEAKKRRVMDELKQKEQRYRQAISQMQSASTEAQFKKAASLFKELGDFEESAAKAKSCEKRAEEVRLEKEYSDALKERDRRRTLEDAGHVFAEKDYLDLAKSFENLGSYKDSEAFAVQCRTKAEGCRKDSVLKSAKHKMEIAKRGATDFEIASDFAVAKKQFESIAGWKDADQRAKTCQKYIRKYTPWMKRGRRIAAGAIAVVVIAACVVIGWNSTHFEVDGVRYSSPLFAKRGDVATVEGFAGTNSEVTIPSHVNGLFVKRMAANAFKDNAQIERVVIEGDIESIPNGAFSGGFARMCG